MIGRIAVWPQSVCLLALAAGAVEAQLPASGPQQGTMAAPITMTLDNVDLDGAGIFAFEPDSSAFSVDPPAGGGGLSFTVRLWFDPAGKPLSCDVGASPLAEATRTACAQLLQSATFRLLPGMAMPLRRGFVDVRFSFFKDPPGSPPGRKMFALAEPGYRNVPIEYPADETPPAARLQQTDGSLTVPIQADDYPPIAMRYGLESASAVLVGIDRSGQLKSCRPVSANGARTAYLDNHTCALFLRRGRFEFSPGYPVYDGLRYLTRRMRWKLP
jgi:hypothetical protein